MNIKDLKTMSAWGVKKWIDTVLPKDGDYADPQIITDRKSAAGGDYVLIFVFHDNSIKNEEPVMDAKGEIKL